MFPAPSFSDCSELCLQHNHRGGIAAHRDPFVTHSVIQTAEDRATPEYATPDSALILGSRDRRRSRSGSWSELATISTSFFFRRHHSAPELALTLPERRSGSRRPTTTGTKRKSFDQMLEEGKLHFQRVFGFVRHGDPRGARGKSMRQLMRQLGVDGRIAEGSREATFGENCERLAARIMSRAKKNAPRRNFHRCVHCAGHASRVGVARMGHEAGACPAPL